MGDIADDLFNEALDIMFQEPEEIDEDYYSDFIGCNIFEIAEYFETNFVRYVDPFMNFNGRDYRENRATLFLDENDIVIDWCWG